MPRGRRDTNEKSIIEALRAAGCSVLQLEDPDNEGVPDLLVGHWAIDRLIEVKMPGKEPDPAQRAFYSRWRGLPPLVVHSVEEAYAALGIVAYEIDVHARSEPRSGRVRH